MLAAGSLLRLAAATLLLALAGCGWDGSSVSTVTIENVAVAENLTLTDAARAAFATDLAAVAPDIHQIAVADDAAALAAVRSGAASAALISSAAALHTDGLSVTPAASRPAIAYVWLTLPVESVTAQQFRDLAGGRIRNWRELGGPALAVDVAWRDQGTLTGALGGAAEGVRVEDVTAALAARRGRVVFSDAATGGALGKPLRVDGLLPADSSYPIAARWVVVGRAADQRAVALGRALAQQSAGRGGDDIIVAAVGDIMLDREVRRSITTRGGGYPFEAVAPLLAGADLRIGNLELPLTDRGAPANKDYVFRAPPATADALRGAGFNVLTLANNHAMDYGKEGLLDTLDALDRAGIAHPGGGRTAAEAYAPAIVTVKGVRVALLSYVNTPNDSRSGWAAESTRAGPAAPGVAWGTADAVRRDVTAARSQADLVIVAIHAGWEYTAAPNPIQRELARAAIDAGAALVLGAHPHVLQGIELYRNVPIVYSLGNFVFDLDDDDRRQPGLPSTLSAVLRIRMGREGVRGIEILPAVIDQRDGHPVPVTGAAAKPVLDRLYALTDALAGG